MRRPQRDRLGLQHHRREHACREPGGDTERERADQVAEVERRLARDGEEPVGAVDRDEREVAGRRRDERGEEHAPAEVVLIRHLDREDRAGGRCLEDRGDARRRARDHEKAAISVAEQPRQSLLGLRPDGRAEVERRPFEAHRAAEPERGDRGGDARDEGPDREEHIGIVVRAEVLVGSRTRHASTDERERGEREQQADGRRQCRPPTAGAPRSGARRPLTTMRSNPATPKPVTAPTSPAMITTCADFSTTLRTRSRASLIVAAHPAAHA